MDGPMPYIGVSTDMAIRYMTMEKWVHDHAAHIHVMNDIFPGREIALGWLKIIKQMKTSTEELMQKCHTPADVKTAALMIKWLVQLRKCISNIGRVKAAREGVIAEMDNIHTDDELAQPAESQKSQSRHPSKTRDIPTAPAKLQLFTRWNNPTYQPLLIPMTIKAQTQARSNSLSYHIQQHPHPLLYLYSM
jgi:hypothetical protein